MQHIVYSYVEKIKEGIVLIQDEMVVWANKAGCNILGYELEEVVNKSAVEMAHPKYREQLSARFAMVQAGEDIPPGCDLAVHHQNPRDKILQAVHLRCHVHGPAGHHVIFLSM